MKRFYFLLSLLCILLIATPSKAQYLQKESGFSINANANLAFPIADYADVFQFGYGLHFGVNYKIAPKWEIFADLGYYTWNFSREYLRNQILPFTTIDLPDIQADASYRALKFFPGIRFYVTDYKIRPYAEAAFSLIFVRFPDMINVDLNPLPPPNNILFADPKYKNAFKTGANIGIGVLIPTTSRSSLDISLSYSTIFQELNQTFNYINPVNTFTTENSTIISNIIVSAGYKIKI